LLQQQCPSLPVRARGFIPVKGKDDMFTYWVNESKLARIDERGPSSCNDTDDDDDDDDENCDDGPTDKDSHSTSTNASQKSNENESKKGNNPLSDDFEVV